MPNKATINRKQLLVELSASEPILKREAQAILIQQFFDPAVTKMKKEFEESLITQEIKAGPHSENISGTLEGFGDPPEAADGREIKDYNPPNLVSFIGLPDGPKAIEEIEKRLDPSHGDGPKVKYRGMDKQQLTFTFEVKAPDSEAIYDHTPFQGWADGLSWAKRIEQGIPGVNFFLNALKRKNSRSGGGIQIDNRLRAGRFKPTSYLSKIFNNFLRRVSSGREPVQ